MGNDTTIWEAFSAFEKKMKRFVSAHDKKLSPAPPDQDTKDRRIIEEHEALFKKSVIDTYKKFTSPFEVLGKNSSIAAEISKDKESLAAAYNLYTAIDGVNKQFGTEETFIKGSVIESPLTGRDRYTIGGEFIYLQCWLLYEYKKKDFVPQLVFNNAANEYRLQFVPQARYRFSGKELEIQAAITECFYPMAK